MFENISYAYSRRTNNLFPLQVTFQHEYEEYKILFTENYGFKICKEITRYSESKNRAGHLVCETTTFMHKMCDSQISNETLSKLHLPSEGAQKLNKDQIHSIVEKAMESLKAQQKASPSR
jgi:hypothetical protein